MFAGRAESSDLIQSDNIAIIEYISSVAGILRKHQFVGEEVVEELRLALREAQLESADRAKPVLLTTLNTSPSFYEALTIRYGLEHLCQNILRYRMVDGLKKMNSQITDLGKQILEKSKINFNRPFPIYDGEVLDSWDLTSSLLVSLAESYEKSSSLLVDSASSLLSMLPHRMAAGVQGDSDVDREVAEALGFITVSTESFPFLTLSRAKGQVSFAVKTVAETFLSLAESFVSATDKSSGLTVRVLIDSLKVEAQHLDALSFGKSDRSVADWEVKRLSVVKVLDNMNGLVKEIGEVVTDNIKTTHLDRQLEQQRISKSINRRISADLVGRGVMAKEAAKAASDLVHYCDSENIEPKDILIGEIGRINPSLVVDSLHLLQNLSTEEKIVSGHLEKKKITLEKAQELAKKFESNLKKIPSHTILVSLLGIFLGGCGLKMAPKSSLSSFRPEIPFHKNAVIDDRATSFKVDENKTNKLDKDNGDSK